MMFGPKNSLILVYDHLTENSPFGDQLDEVSRFYKFTKLGDLVDRLKRGKVRGRATVVFSHARKSLFLHGVPILRARNIPVTVFLHPDCVGTNRLPGEEEENRTSPEDMDPTRFFVTWGKLLALPPTLREFGLHLSPSENPVAALDFIGKQTGERPRLGLSDNTNGAPIEGLDGIVSGLIGSVEKKTDPFSLPRWQFSDD